MAALSRELCGALGVSTDVIDPAQLHGLVNNPGITDLGDRSDLKLSDLAWLRSLSTSGVRRGVTRDARGVSSLGNIRTPLGCRHREK
jgi:hypothetical protein